MDESSLLSTPRHTANRPRPSRKHLDLLWVNKKTLMMGTKSVDFAATAAKVTRHGDAPVGQVSSTCCCRLVYRALVSIKQGSA